jgi:4-amino-4-deoxy-L-arabinose transferase-like glycosyltransferase
MRKFLTGKMLSSNLWVWLTYALFFTYLILIIGTFLDYGITFDEDWRLTYGEHIIQWYASGFQDKGALTYWTLPLEGGFFNVVARLATRISPVGVFETTHLVNAIFGLLGAVGVYKVGRLLAGSFAGFLSALFLLVTPRFYGNAFNNPVDIPMATLSIFSIYYLISSIHYLPHIPRGLLIKLGVVLGLALAVRPGAIILLGYAGLAFFLWFLSHYLLRREGRQSIANLRATFFRLGGSVLGVCLIAYLVMLIWWPAAQVRPIIQPLKGLRFASNFIHSFTVFFEGSIISSKDLPWYYVSKWFLITLPEFYFIGLTVGVALGAISIVQSWKKLSFLRNEWNLKMLVLLVSIGLPIGYTLLINPVEYDGIRHYLFIIPPLAVLVAISVAKLIERVAASFTIGVLMIAIITSVAMTIVDMVQLHPHQYIYFNRIFGKGVAEAAKSFETDYWGNTYKEGAEWITKYYKNPNGNRKVKVASCLYSLSTSYFLPKDRFEYVGSFGKGQMISDSPDLFLATTRWNCHKKLSGRVLHIIERKGAPLLYIIEVSRGLSSVKEKE